MTKLEKVKPNTVFLGCLHPFFLEIVPTSSGLHLATTQQLLLPLDRIQPLVLHSPQLPCTWILS